MKQLFYLSFMVLLLPCKVPDTFARSFKQTTPGAKQKIYSAKCFAEIDTAWSYRGGKLTGESGLRIRNFPQAIGNTQEQANRNACKPALKWLNDRAHKVNELMDANIKALCSYRGLPIHNKNGIKMVKAVGHAKVPKSSITGNKSTPGYVYYKSDFGFYNHGQIPRRYKYFNCGKPKPPKPKLHTATCFAEIDHLVEYDNGKQWEESGFRKRNFPAKQATRSFSYAQRMACRAPRNYIKRRGKFFKLMVQSVNDLCSHKSGPIYGKKNIKHLKMVLKARSPKENGNGYNVYYSENIKIPPQLKTFNCD